MINFIPNSNTFRTVPNQSGNYQIDFTVFLNNHSSNINFSLSGHGSRFFNFGIDSGNYYASGNSKLYFEANTPNAEREYSFVISDSQFDVYKDDEPIILGGVKSTGICQRIGVSTTTEASGQFELELFGNSPLFFSTGTLVFPINGNFTTGIGIVNSGTVPFSVLSGQFEAVDFISGVNNLPIFITPGQTGIVNFSGRLDQQQNSSTLITLNTDSRDEFLNFDLFWTYYSGSGIQISQTGDPFIAYGDSTTMSFNVFNTGTQIVSTRAIISGITREIPIALPTYSGVSLGNYFSGYFDTPSQFYLSDKITSSGAIFHIIAQVETGVPLLSITGETTTTGYSLGANSNHSVGQSFVFPYPLPLTGFSVKLATQGDTFDTSDIVYCQVRAGHGVSGAVLATSSVVACSDIPSGFANGTPFNFILPAPLPLISGNTYTVALTGAPNWINNSSVTKKIFLLYNTGNVYGQGSGFMYNGSSTNFTGDAILDITYQPATGSHRYLINHLSGNQYNFVHVTTGTYDKYAQTQSFITDGIELFVPPSNIVTVPVTYSGVVSGVNFANITLSGLGYSATISGETF